MSFSSQQERAILAHVSNSNNPHQITSSQVGINNTDDMVEGAENLFSAPYTLDPVLKEALEQKFNIEIDLHEASTTEVFNLIFDLIYRG